MDTYGTGQRNELKQPDEGGYLLVILATMFVPMILAIGTFSVAMTGRSNELRVELDRERALLAAESGIDDAVYRGQIGSLVAGTAYSRDLGGGMGFTVTPTHLLTDTEDNDNDGDVDEADEDVYQVEVVGTFRNTRRRIAAYFGTVPLLPVGINAALGMQNPNPTVILQGNPLVSGHNLTISGGAGAGSMPGMSIVPAGSAALLAQLSSSEQNKVVGAGGTPSLGTMASIDMTTLVAQIQNAANLVLTSSSYSAYDFGNGSAGITNIAYRDGNVKFAGNSQGAGILVVTGDLEVKGNFRFDGVVIVLGDLVNSAGTADIYGSILQGPAGGKIEIKGNMNVHYSSEAITLANSTTGQTVAFNGWQELAR